MTGSLVSDNTLNLSKILQETDVTELFGYYDITDNDQPFYVGIGRERRVKLKGRNKKHTYVSMKHGFTRVVKMSVVGPRKLVWDWLCKWEIATIAELRTLHEKDNIGCNFTMGGDGFVGFTRIKSAEECAKISARQKALFANKDNRIALGLAISLAKTDPVKYENHCRGQQKRYADPAARAKMFETNTQKKRVQQLTLDGIVVAEFESLSKAVQETGVLNIKKVCRGKRPRAGGFLWRYLD